MLQSVSHVGRTGRRVLHSGHDLLLDGVDHKQQSVWWRTADKRAFSTQTQHSIYYSSTIRGSTFNFTRLKNRCSCINYNNHNHCRGLLSLKTCGVNVPYSVLSPQSFTLFASYWAFFFRRHALQNTTGERSLLMEAPGDMTHCSQISVATTISRRWTRCVQMCVRNAWIIYLDASLFFSLRDRGRAVSGSSLTGVKSLITLFSLRSSVPICSSLRGFGVRSSTSVRRDFFSIYFPTRGEKKRSR